MKIYFVLRGQISGVILYGILEGISKTQFFQVEFLECFLLLEEICKRYFFKSFFFLIDKLEKGVLLGWVQFWFRVFGWVGYSFVFKGLYVLNFEFSWG